MLWLVNNQYPWMLLINRCSSKIILFRFFNPIFQQYFIYFIFEHFVSCFILLCVSFGIIVYPCVLRTCKLVGFVLTNFFIKEKQFMFQKIYKKKEFIVHHIFIQSIQYTLLSLYIVHSIEKKLHQMVRNFVSQLPMREKEFHVIL